MTKFTFDPTDPQACILAQQVISLFQSETAVIGTPTETAATETMTLVNVANTINDATGVELDSNGMPWNGDYHASTKTKTTDGSWKCRQGKKDELAAAIAAHNAGAVADVGATMTAGIPAPAAAAGMPSPAAAAGMPSPAAAAPATPPTPISYATMSARFVGKMESGQVSNFEIVYQDLAIDFNDLETNQTSIARLSAYMDALDANHPHESAVTHAYTVG